MTSSMIVAFYHEQASSQVGPASGLRTVVTGRG